MARSITDIEQVILTEKNSSPALSALNSPSDTAIWRVWVYIVAFAQHTLEKFWDIVRQELVALGLMQIIGTLEWYRGLALNWQSGAVVKRASCRESGSRVILKVAKLAPGNTTVNLTAAELNDLATYIKGKKVAGTDLDIISQTADLVSITMQVQFSGVQSQIEADIKTAFKTYLNTLPFDSPLSKTLIADAILQVPGVLDVSVDVLAVDLGLGYQVVPGNNEQADAGFWQVGTSGGNDLITLVMYQ